ncbi:MAG: TetR/AcrR family transcriptional regulator [Bdellovibrionaceae bacterium]|nr:TetR/AcrR family transcriptional regulator [Pseudobdellovibrionaceae bacterium]MBX3032983.1 TetR/AcrR family transcriptional regulator [Pseudobdellovibrionaceae bacterium]
MAVKEGTKIRALREATGLLQTFGFNGFSFQHVADLLGIRKPSLYDHFASKEELGEEMVKDYHQRFLRWAESVQEREPRERIQALFDLFRDFSSDSGKLCPMSAMIADYHSVSKNTRKLLRKMFSSQEAWVVECVAEGQKKKIFRRDLPARELAQAVMSAGLGAQLIARVTEDAEALPRAREQILRNLED